MFTTSLYVIALCKLVSALPQHRGQASEIIRRFERTHRNEIPPHHYENDSSGWPAYVKQLQWCRQRAVLLGWMDSPQRGIWHVTEKGRAWLAANPDAQQVPPLPVSQTSKERHSIPQAKIEARTKPVPISVHSTVKNEYVYQQELVMEQIRRIEKFLEGRSDVRASDEQLCDWVNFCYSFEMYPEGRDLFRLVAADGVNPWYFERTRKMAKICELRARED